MKGQLEQLVMIVLQIQIRAQGDRHTRNLCGCDFQMVGLPVPFAHRDTFSKQPQPVIEPHCAIATTGGRMGVAVL